jgi:DNA-binding response OmpR family regulator
MRILVAEDEGLMLKTIELKLKKDGHEVITSADGKDALIKVDLHEPDLIITDMMLPYVSGLEIIVAVKKREKKIPLLFYQPWARNKP